MSAGLSIGSAFATLGAKFDNDGFDRWERRLDKARVEGERGVTTELKVDSDHAKRGLDQYERSVHSAGKTNDDFVRGSARVKTGIGSLFLGGAGFAVATTGFYAFGKSVKFAFDQYKDSERIGKQTVAVIKSTGGEAGITAKQVGDLATAISNKTGVDDEAIQSTENLLLTFTNLRNEAGKGNDVFNQTTKLATDMSAALGQDAKSSAIQLGKALNDPVKGVTALSRVGVSFTAQQKEQIKTLTESGNVLGAQKVVLKEVSKEFGGSAEAIATSGGKLKVTLGNVAETVGKAVSPVIEKASGKLNTFVNGMLNGEGAGGAFAKSTGAAFTYIGKAATTAADIGEHVFDFLRNNEDVQKYVATARQILGRFLDALDDLRASIAKTFEGVGPELETIVKAFLKLEAAAIAVVGWLTSKTLPGLVKAIEGVAQVVRGVIQIIAGLLSGDFGKAWEGAKRVVGGALDAMLGLVSAATAPMRAVFGAIFKPLASIAEAAFGGVKSVVSGAFDFIAGGASSLLGIIGDVVDTASKIPFIGGKFKGLAGDIRGAQRSIDGYRESLRDTNDEHKRADGRLDAQRDRVNKLKDRLDNLDEGTRAYRSTARKLKDAQDDLNTSLRNADAAGTKGARGVSRIGGAAGNALDVVIDAATDIAANVNSLAKGLGLTGGAIKFVASKHHKTVAFERGGYLGAPGMRGDDTELVLAAPGEAFLTHHQQGPVEDALAFASAMGLNVPSSLDGVFGDKRAHRFQSGGRLGGLARFASGGFHTAPGTNYSVGDEPELARRLQRLAVALGLNLTGISGYRTPAHSVEVGGFANDPHTRGQASDTPGVEGVSEQNLERFGLTRPFGGARELNHIQLFGGGGLGTGSLGAVGAAAAQIAAGTVTGPAGAFKSIAQAAVTKLTGAANAKLGATGGGGATSAGGQYSKAALMSLWIQAGGRPAAAPLAAAIALAESGGNPNASNRNTNGTIDRGLWQINSIHGALSVFPPLANARAAVRISANGTNWRPWVTYNTGAYRKFFQTGGRLGRAIARFARGGRLGLSGLGPAAAQSTADAIAGPGGTQYAANGLLGVALRSVRAPIKAGAPSPIYKEPGYIGLRRLQTDRIGAYDNLIGDVDDLNTRYSIADRKFSLSDEELIKDDGTIDQAAIDKRAGELAQLAIIRTSIVQRLTRAREVTRRILTTYRTLIKRLVESRKHTKGKTRTGLTNTINAYRGRVKEWDGTRRELTNDKIPNAELDVSELMKERAGVLGTTAETQAAEAPDTGGGSDASSGSDSGSSSSSDSGSDTVAPPSAEDIAQGVAAALAQFNTSRSDLFSQFGSNFATGYVQGDETALAAGARYYGATGAGDAFGGGAYDPAAQAGGDAPRVSIVNNYAAPPPDPHTWSADLSFELTANL